MSKIRKRVRPVTGGRVARLDPSRTITLRRQFQRDLAVRFDRLRRDIIELVVKEDAFGLKQRKPFAFNAFCPTGEGGGHDNSCSPNRGHVTKTPAFKKWFGKSRVVSKTGEPLVMYHGTDVNIKEFKRDTIWTTSSTDIAAEYTGGEFQNIYPVYLKIENPLILESPVHDDVLQGWVKAAKLNGHDGLIARRVRDNGIEHVTAVAFSSTQVKSSIGNKGTFDPDDPIVTHTATMNTRWQFHSTEQKLAAFYQWIKRKILEYIIGDVVDENAWWASYIADGFRRGAARAFDDTRPQVREWQESAEAQQRLAWYNGTREEFLRSSFNWPVSQEKVKLLASRTFTDLKGVTDSMAARISHTLVDGLTKGDNPRVIGKALAKEVSVGKVRSQTIARTECLPGDTLVSGAVVRAVFRRWYDGDMIEVETCDGRKFSATPNHPMLTRRGWVPAGMLNDLDDLVCDSRQQSLSSSGDKNVDHRPTSLSEIFTSLQAVVISERVGCSRGDFHGDGSNGNVDILRPGRELMLGRFSSIYEPLKNGILADADETTAPTCHFCGRLLSVNKQKCFCAGSQGTLSISQSATDYISTDPQTISDDTQRLPTLVSTLDIENIQSLNELVSNPPSLPRVDLPFRNRPTCVSFPENITDRFLISADKNSNLSLGESRLIQPGDLGSFGFSPPFDMGHFASLDALDGSITVASSEPFPGNHPPHCIPPDTNYLRNIVEGQSTQVQFDRVRSVRVVPFSGHVYNIETRDGYYCIDSLYTGNTIRTHAEGQLDAFDRLGVTEVGVMSEWLTAGDDRVCKLCHPLEGVVLKVSEARGLLPRHPGCRCAWTPANLGEDPKGQKRSRKSIFGAFKSSYKAEMPKTKERTLQEQIDLSPWGAADKKISKTRPESPV